MTDLDYADFVSKRFLAARLGDPVVFTNRGDLHARTVLSHLINSAKSSLDIYTGFLSASVYRAEELRTKARLLGKAAVRILIGDQLPFPELSALNYLQSEIDEGFIVPRLSKMSAEQLQGLNHFAIADRSSLRVEHNHAEKTAVVILNAHKVNLPDVPDKTLAESYNELFEQLFETSREFSRQAA